MKTLKKKKIDPAVIPGGLTGLLQAPDVSWNGPFKAHLREEYDNWIEMAPKTFTKATNVRAPTKSDIYDMILRAWKKLDTDLIVKSFRACGQTRHTRVEDIAVIKEGNKAREAFETVREFWNNLECLTQHIINQW